MRLMRTPSVGWDRMSERQSMEQIKNKMDNSCEYGEARQDAEMTPQALRRRSLAPPAAREDLACLPSTKIPPHNSATATAASVTRYAYRRCRAMSPIGGNADDICSM